jgi:DNA-binding transcriptional regulator YdaS (Cro superfamily)
VTLIDWIIKVGNKEAAKRLQVSVRTVQSYRQGVRVPKRQRAMLISRITGGKVSFKECYPNEERASNGD